MADGGGLNATKVGKQAMLEVAFKLAGNGAARLVLDCEATIDNRQPPKNRDTVENNRSQNLVLLLTLYATVRSRVTYHFLQKVSNNNNNNDILLRTHGPYHRHKNTKSG